MKDAFTKIVITKNLMQTQSQMQSRTSHKTIHDKIRLQNMHDSMKISSFKTLSKSFENKSFCLYSDVVSLSEKVKTKREKRTSLKIHVSTKVHRHWQENNHEEMIKSRIIAHEHDSNKSYDENVFENQQHDNTVFLMIQSIRK